MIQWMIGPLFRRFGPQVDRGLGPHHHFVA